MKPLLKIVCVLLAAVTLVSAGFCIYYMLHQRDVEEIVHRMTVPPQQSAETPKEFIPEEMQTFVPPEGENLAPQAKLTESGHTDVYFGAKATDGRNTTYWEGDGFPSSLTLDLQEEHTITKIAFCLPPLRVWGARTQTVLIETSADGETYSPLLPEQTLSFDPLTGNAVLLTFDPLAATGLRFTFLSNTGAAGGQASEIMIFE
ncbi:MAG: discoidin domain-containing protein [Clostridiales bacterium]|nr:discoidin domain-containing protein [Clostridiales bacterium]